MIIITDIHGCYKTMRALLKKCPKDDIVVCGDLVDRGPRSMQVVEYIKKNKIPCVKGNHEDLMVRSLSSPDSDQIWGMNGGQQTIDSYHRKDGTLNKKKLQEHRLWMDNLPLYIEFKDVKNDKGDYLVISHSSIGKIWQWSEEKKKQQAQYVESIVMWGRSPPEFAGGIYNVFGHTPHPVNDIRIKSFYANIDTGACFSSEQHKEQGYGVLTALQFPSMKIFQQENID